MTLPSSGAISMGTIASAFGLTYNTPSRSIGADFRFPAGSYTPDAPALPTVTSSLINIDLFHGKTTVGCPQWCARSGDSGVDTGRAIAVNGTEIYITGDYTGTCTFYNSDGTAFATTLASMGGQHIFIAKYNSSGVVQWCARAGSSGADVSSGRAIAVNGTEVYITGVYSGTCTFYNSAGTAFATTLAQIGGGINDIFIAKYNSSGAVQWCARAGSNGDDIGRAIAVNGTEVYITGVYTTTCTFYNSAGTAFATTLSRVGNTDIFIAKYNSSGAVQWCARAGSSGAGSGYSIAVNGTEVYITGVYSGICTFYNSAGTAFATTLAQIGGQDIFIAKYNSSGAVQWCARAGSSGADSGYSIAVNGTEVYITGNYTGTCTFYNSAGTAFATTLAPMGNTDIFIAKYNSSGVVQWCARAGSSGADSGYSIAVNSSNVYIAGFYTGPCTFYNSAGTAFATTLALLGSNDIFIVKYMG